MSLQSAQAPSEHDLQFGRQSVDTTSLLNITLDALTVIDVIDENESTIYTDCVFDLEILNYLVVVLY